MPIRKAVKIGKLSQRNLNWILLGASFLSLLIALIHFFGESGRGPAAINHRSLFSQPLPNDLQAMAKEILKDAEIKVAKQESALVLSHFDVAVSGQARSLCEVFDRLEVRFEAEGMAVNGARPTLFIEGPCEAGSGTKMRPIFIPVAMLKAERPSTGVEMTFSPHRQFTYRTENFDGSWPSHWVLTEIRGFSQAAEKVEFRLGRREIYTHSEGPLQMIWE